MKNDTITDFKLSRIIENLNRIPRKVIEEAPKLSPEQKKKLMEMISKYNEYGEILSNEEKILELAGSIKEIAELAESYAMNECGDWFQQEVIKKDFKNTKNTSAEFQKVANETYASIQRMKVLWEDMGHTLSRYYEIKDVQQKPVQSLEPQPLDSNTPPPADGTMGAVNVR